MRETITRRFFILMARSTGSCRTLVAASGPVDCLRGWHIFFSRVSSQIFSTLGGHMVSIAATQLCNCSMRRVINKTSASGCGCVPINCYLQTQEVGGIWPLGHGWLTPVYVYGDSWSRAGCNIQEDSKVKSTPGADQCCGGPRTPRTENLN